VAVAEGPRQPEGVLDQLRSIQPDVAVGPVHQAQHLAAVSLVAPLVADLLGVGNRELGAVCGKVFRQLGLNTNNVAGPDDQNVQVRRATASQVSRAPPFERERLERSGIW
jgi:hypothetical protein